MFELQKVFKTLSSKNLQFVLYGIIVGTIWFLLESSFIFLLQSFFLSLGLITIENTKLPDWFRPSLLNTVFLIIGFGLFRAVLVALKQYIGIAAQHVYLKERRSEVMTLTLLKGEQIDSFKGHGLFGDVANQAGQVVYSVVGLCTSFISIIFFASYGFYIAPYEMIAGVGILSLLYFPLNVCNKYINRTGKVIVEQWTKVNEAFLTSIKNNLLLNIYGVLELEAERKRLMIESYNFNYNKYAFASSLVLSFPIFFGTLTVAILLVAGKKYFAAEGITLVAFFYIFMRCAQTASELFSAYAHVKLNLPAYFTIQSWILDTQALKKNNLVPNIRESETIALQAKNVSVAINDVSIVPPVSFLVTEGDFLHIKGSSGSGKSTLLKVILNLFPASTGEIEYFGFINSDQIFEKTGFVGPEPFLIAGTVKENLLYGNNNTLLWQDENKINEALKAACILGKISSLEKGVDTFLRESAQLSTGEKQRLCIARALLREPKILVFDEATANLDPERELQILNNLKPYLRKSIFIFVSHKASYEAYATKTLTLEKL